MRVCAGGRKIPPPRQHSAPSLPSPDYIAFRAGVLPPPDRAGAAGSEHRWQPRPDASSGSTSCNVLEAATATGHRCSGTAGTPGPAHHTPRRLNDDTAEPPPPPPSFLPLLTIFTYFPVSLHFRAGERTPIEMTAGGRTCARVNSGGNTKGGTMAGTGHTGCARPSARSDGRIRSVTSKYSLFFPFAFFWVGQTATPARIRPHQPPYTVTTTYAAIPVPRAPQSARDTESERGLPP